MAIGTGTVDVGSTVVVVIGGWVVLEGTAVVVGSVVVRVIGDVVVGVVGEGKCVVVATDVGGGGEPLGDGVALTTEAGFGEARGLEATGLGAGIDADALLGALGTVDTSLLVALVKL